MATQVQWRGGSTAEHSTFTGAAREVTVDTQKKTLVVHDGSTAGGEPLLREDQANLPSSVTNGISVPSANNVAISTNGTGRIYIDPNGKIGFNQSSPGSFTTGANNFVLSANDNVGMTIASLSSGLSNIYFADGTTGSEPYRGFVSYNHSTDYLQFGTSGTERLRITADGKLGVGTSTPSGLFHVGPSGAGVVIDNTYSELSPPSSGNDSYVFRSSNDGSLNFSSRPGGGGRSYRFWRGSNVSMIIDDSGRLGIGVATLVGGAGDVSIIRNSSIRWADSDGTQRVDIYGDSSSNFVIRNGTGSTERLRLTSDGKLGLGTSSVTRNFVVRSTGQSDILISAGTTNYSQLIFGDTDAEFRGAVGYNHSNDNLVLTVAGAERARIDASGRLLVGMSSTSSSALLQVQGNSSSSTGDAIIQLRRGENNASILNGESLGSIQFSNSESTVSAVIEAVADANWNTTNDYPSRLVFSTTADGASSPTERLRIANDGLILIGKTTDDLSVNGWAIRSNGTSQLATNVTGGPVQRLNHNGGGATEYLMECWKSGTQVGSISVTASATAFNTSSDYRLKENVVPLTGAADRLNQLQVHRFNFIADPDTTVDGFIAHEAQAVVPECVTGEKDEVDADGNPVYQGIDQSKLVPLLTAALQEALAKIETLEQRLNDAGIA
jgi:hypothetical protein